MSYICAEHGWIHQQRACPLCNPTCSHPQNQGYNQWHYFAEEQVKKGKIQKQCQICGGWFFKEEMK